MKKVIIIGGGFGGSYIARKLERNFEVTLVDSKDYFEFTPGILRSTVKPLYSKKIQVPHSAYLKKSKIITGKVDYVTESYIVLENEKIPFDYDYLAICAGSKYSLPISEENIINANKAELLDKNYSKLEKAKEILLIGGGLVGVELAGEICTRYKDKKITIVHSGKKLIERNHKKAIKCAESFLKKKGVKVIYDEKIIINKKGIFKTDKKTTLKPDITFLCAGIKPNSDIFNKKLSKHLNLRKQIEVNQDLRVKGKNNIFAVGDVNSVFEEKTAHNAEKQAKIAVNNIFALENKKPLRLYKSKKSPLLISLGKYNAILDAGNFSFQGFIPALLKITVEKREIWKLHLAKIL